jgi:hypothetical protein
MRQVEFGGVDDGLARLVTTRYADRLSRVMGLPTAGASRLTSLGAATVLGLGQFVAGIIDHVALRVTGRKREFQTHKAFGEHDDGNE